MHVADQATQRRAVAAELACIDLERRFPMYRVDYEDPMFALTKDPWHKIIKCRRGHISPAGGTKLWACTNGVRSEASRRMLSGELPCTITMHGDDGINAEFDVKDSAIFFDLMGAQKR
jgi:hypothetical protein